MDHILFSLCTLNKIQSLLFIEDVNIPKDVITLIGLNIMELLKKDEIGGKIGYKDPLKNYKRIDYTLYRKGCWITQDHSKNSDGCKCILGKFDIEEDIIVDLYSAYYDNNLNWFEYEDYHIHKN